MSELYEAFVHECYRTEARIAIAIVHPDAAGRGRPFPSSKAFAVMLLAESLPLDQESPLGRALREQVGPVGAVHTRLGEELIERLQLVEEENSPQTEDQFAKGIAWLNERRRRGRDHKSRGFPAVFWKQCVSHLPHATYVLRVTRPELLQHLKVGMRWAGAGYDP